jgi:hypothetical protein
MQLTDRRMIQSRPPGGLISCVFMRAIVDDGGHLIGSDGASARA